MRTIISSLALVATLVTTGSALAESESSCGNAPKAQWMSEDAIKAKATAEGLDVREVKAENGCYEIKAIDKNGARVERVVNPITGEVVANEEGE